MMAQINLDGVIETVHYSPEGLIQQARIYERRGPTYSDRLLLSRDELINRIKDGKNFFTGKRVPYMASTFELNEPVRLVKLEDKEYLVTGNSTSPRDDLGTLPVI